MHTTTKLSCFLFTLCCVGVLLGGVEAGVPFPPYLDTCDSAVGTQRTFVINATTWAGSSEIVYLGHRAAHIGYIEFFFNGTCVGNSRLPGSSPVVAFLRKDGIPWDREHIARMTLFEEPFFFMNDPTYTPFVVSFFGYEGRCNVELHVRYCECLDGQIGTGCRHRESPWDTEVVATPGFFNYHCIPQRGSTQEVVNSYNVLFELLPANQTANILIDGRWGAPPLFFSNDEVFLSPPNASIWLNVSYPRFETEIINRTCYYIGIFNPGPANVTYNLTLPYHKICNGTYGDNCDVAIQHANFSDPITAIIHTNQFFIAEFLPHSLFPMRHPRFYEFTLTTSEPDLDFFVRRDAPPTLTLYDHYSNDSFINRTIRVPFPGFGPQGNSKWFAGVYRVQGDTVLYFTLEAKAIFCDECVSPNGICTNLNDSYPFCQCSASYTGRGCEIGITTLGLQTRQQFNLATRGANYHQFKVPAFLSPLRAVLNLHIVVTSGGPVEFYLRHRYIPTTYDYHYRSGLSNLTFAIARPNLVEGDQWYLSAEDFGNAPATYQTYLIAEEETPTPITSSSSTGFSFTSSTTSRPGSTSTTGQNTVVVPVYRNSPGAMAGLAFGMLFTGALLGVGGLWVLRRRGYQPLSQL